MAPCLLVTKSSPPSGGAQKNDTQNKPKKPQDIFYFDVPSPYCFNETSPVCLFPTPKVNIKNIQMSIGGCSKFPFWGPSGLIRSRHPDQSNAPLGSRRDSQLIICARCSLDITKRKRKRKARLSTPWEHYKEGEFPSTEKGAEAKSHKGFKEGVAHP